MNSTASLEKPTIKLISIMCNQEIGLSHNGEAGFQDWFIVNTSLRRKPARKLINRQNVSPFFAKPFIAEVKNKTEIGTESVDSACLKVPQEDFQGSPVVTFTSKSFPRCGNRPPLRCTIIGLLQSLPGAFPPHAEGS